MAELARVRVIWDRNGLPIQVRHFHEVHIGPEPGWPHGRKGLALFASWRQLAGSKTAGMLMMDGDVAADPADLAAALAAVHTDPARVWTAPVKLWPRSTGRESWVWGHWRGEPSQELEPYPDRFSFGLTYLPRALLELPALKSWTFPRVDLEVSKAAAKMRLGVSVIPDCWPRHLHF